MNANDRNPQATVPALGRRGPEPRYNRLVDAAGIEAAGHCGWMPFVTGLPNAVRPRSHAIGAAGRWTFEPVTWALPTTFRYVFRRIPAWAMQCDHYPRQMLGEIKRVLARLCQELGLQVIVLEPTCGFVACLGLLGTVAITRALHRWPAVLRPVLLASRAFQHSVCLNVDDRVDRSKRFAQGHSLVAQNA